MKIIILMLIGFISLSCKAQTKQQYFIYGDSSEKYNYDTVPVIMLVCDTSSHPSFYGDDTNDLPIGMAAGITWFEHKDFYYDHSMFWLYGYSVGYKYLNRSKRPLQKNFIVWQSKKL